MNQEDDLWIRPCHAGRAVRYEPRAGFSTGFSRPRDAYCIRPFVHQAPLPLSRRESCKEAVFQGKSDGVEYVIERFLHFMDEKKGDKDRLRWYHVNVCWSMMLDRLNDYLIPFAALFAGDMLCFNRREWREAQRSFVWLHEKSKEELPVTAGSSHPTSMSSSPSCMNARTDLKHTVSGFATGTPLLTPEGHKGN